MIGNIEKFVSVVTALARVIWTYKKNYKAVETLMQESIKFLSEVIDQTQQHTMNRESTFQKLINILRTNQAHAIYMQDGRNLDAMVVYEEIINHHLELGVGNQGLLTCEPIVLANLCVVYIIAK